MALEKITRHRIPLRTLDTYIRPTELKMVRHFFGTAGLNLLRYLHRPDTNPNLVPNENSLEAMDDFFFSNLSKEFQIKPGQEVEFYRRQLKRGNKLISYFLEKLDLPAGKYSLRNEVDLYPDKPSQRLMLLGDINGVGKTVRFEVARQLLLAMAIAPLDIRASEYKLETNLADLQYFLDKNLYLGKIGETAEISVFFEHENSTNTVKRYEVENSFQTEKGTHLKQTSFEVRNVFFGPQVLTGIRHKGENESAVKAIERSFHEDKPIDVLESVQDSSGMQFAVVGDKSGRDKFIDSFEKLIASQYKNFKAFEPDNKTNNDRGQNQPFERRSKLHLHNVPTPIEIIYYSLGEHLNSIYEVGKDNDGRAHELYELRRLGHAAEHLFPPEIYEGEEEITIESYVKDKINTTADILRAKNSI